MLELRIAGGPRAPGAAGVRARARALPRRRRRQRAGGDPPLAPGRGARPARGGQPRGSRLRDRGGRLPAHLLVHSDGSIWYSAYWGGNHLGRLDPATGAFQRFPLPDPAGKRTCDYAGCDCFAADPAARCATHCCHYLLLGWGPWSLVEGEGGSVLTCGQTSLAVARLDTARAAAASCAVLDAAGRNPCLTEWPVPGTSFERDLVHSIAAAPDGKVWVTWSPGLGHHRDPSSPASIGYLPPDGERILALPPLSLFGFVDGGGEFASFGGAGIAVGPGGAIWFGDYFRHRLGRVKRR